MEDGMKSVGDFPRCCADLFFRFCILPKFNIDTKNHCFFLNMCLRLQIWRHFGDSCFRGVYLHKVT